MHQRATKPAPTAVYSEALLIVAAAALIFAPLVQQLPVRSTGDEKTYILQALEMAQQHTWFKQTLFDQPNYYKGPLFYQLLRLGWLIFGDLAPISLIYMNILGLVAAALTLWRLLKVIWGDDHGASLMAPVVLLCSAGAYAHALASQMEALLIATYTAFAALLGRPKLGAPVSFALRCTMWGIAGVAGWLKSPLHAGLLGVSALLYWTISGDARSLLKKPREWCALGFGIAVGVAGYLPMLLGDRRVFVATFLGREHFGKDSNGVTVAEALGPLISAHLFPWAPLLLFAAWSLRRSAWSEPTRRMLRLALALALPTAVFFIAHACRNGVYVLPILPALALVIAAGWYEAHKHAAGLPIKTAALTLTALSMGLLSLAVMAVVWRLSPWPSWWGEASTANIAVALLCGTLLYGATPMLREARLQPACLLVASAAFYFGAGRLSTALAAHEVADLQSAGLIRSGATFIRLNLHEHLWTETGILQFMLRRPVRGSTSTAQLTESLAPSTIFLVPDDEQLASLTQLARDRPDLQLQVHPWRRWRLHGEADDGTPLWLQAWRRRSLSPLERHEYAVAITTAPLRQKPPASPSTGAVTTALGDPSR